jgi:hypothetical protein
MGSGSLSYTTHTYLRCLTGPPAPSLEDTGSGNGAAKVCCTKGVGGPDRLAEWSTFL